MTRKAAAAAAAVAHDGPIPPKVPDVRIERLFDCWSGAVLIVRRQTIRTIRITAGGATTDGGIRLGPCPTSSGSNSPPKIGARYYRCCGIEPVNWLKLNRINIKHFKSIIRQKSSYLVQAHRDCLKKRKFNPFGNGPIKFTWSERQDVANQFMRRVRFSGLANHAFFSLSYPTELQ